MFPCASATIPGQTAPARRQPHFAAAARPHNFLKHRPPDKMANPSASTVSTLSVIASPVTPLKNNPSGDLEGVGTNLSPLAKKIPQAKKGGCSTIEQKKRDTNRKCFVNVVDWLCKNEQHSPHVWNLIISGGLGLEKEVDGSLWFDKPPKSVGKVDSTWKAQRIVERSDGKLTAALMKVLDDADPRLIHDMFSRFTCTNGSETLPAEFQEKAIFSLAMDLKMKELGDFGIARWVP